MLFRILYPNRGDAMVQSAGAECVTDAVDISREPAPGCRCASHSSARICGSEKVGL
jgi:hypothetical protein